MGMGPMLFVNSGVIASINADTNARCEYKRLNRSIDADAWCE